MIQKHVVIAGAGITGSYLAVRLAEKGYRVTVLEKLSKKEILSSASKRSYNLTLYGFALNLLKKAGIWNEIKTQVIPLKGSVTQLPYSQGAITSTNNSKKAPYYAISRPNLLLILLNKALKNNNVKVLFSSSLISANSSEHKVAYRNSTGGIATVSCDLVAGCDGVNSKVRELILKNTKGSLSKEYSNWVYQQIIFTKDKATQMNLSPDFAYTWSSKNTVVASFPNKDKSVTALLIYPLEKRPTFRVFKKLFPSLSSIEKEFELAQDASEGRFVTLHSTNWVFRDFMLILGDAAHGFNPFFGQGISAGMGDVQRLLEVIDSSENPERALSRYVDSRKLQMDALGELSKEGFERYRRDKIADFDVIYDKIESILHQYLPKYFAPSIFESISQDPGLAHTYLQKRISQRNLLNMLGMSVIVKLIIALLEVKQNVSHVKLPVILPLGKNTMKIS